MTRFLVALAGGALATLLLVGGAIASWIATFTVSGWFAIPAVLLIPFSVVAGLYTLGGLFILGLVWERRS